MTEHEKFNEILREAGLTRREFAKRLGLKFTSLTSQMGPSKPLPKWAKSVLIVKEKIEQNT